MHLKTEAVMLNAGGAFPFLLALRLVSSRLAKASWLPVPTQNTACILHLSETQHLKGGALLPLATGFLYFQKKY